MRLIDDNAADTLCQVRQEWDKLSNFLQEEQQKTFETKETILDRKEEGKEGENVAHDEASINSELQDQQSERAFESDRGIQDVKMAQPEKLEETTRKDDQLPVYDEPVDEEEASEEESEDEYVEGRRKKSNRKVKKPTKGKGKRNPSYPRRSERKVVSTVRKSGAHSRQLTSVLVKEEVALPPSPSQSSDALMQLKIQKLGDLHRRACTNGREIGCQFCSILDCKLGSEEHYRKELEGGCPCNGIFTILLLLFCICGLCIASLQISTVKWGLQHMQR